MKKLYTTMILACCTALYATAQHSPEFIAAKQADKQAALAARLAIPPSQPLAAPCSGNFIPLLHEDFESGQPAGWTFTVTGVGAWAFDASNNGISYPISGNWAVVNDDVTNIGIAVATSPVLDAHGADIQVSFYYDLQSYIGDGDLYVEFWDGTTWLFVDQANAFSTSSTKFCDDDCYGNITLTADAGTFGNSDFQFRLTYDDEGSDAWGFGFDDVSVCAEVICNNALQGGQFPALAVTPDPTGVTTIDICNNEGQYSVVTGIVSSTNYQFTSTNGGGYITVTTGAVDGSVLGAGYSPITVGALSNDDLYVHWTADEFCGTGSTCITTTVENLGALCLAAAGTATAVAASTCLYQGEATVSVTPNGNQVVPAGYAVVAVLADASGNISDGGVLSYTVTAAGDYYIHIAVIDQADALAYQNAATVAEIHALTIDGGGSLCGSIAQVGTLITVVDCPDNDLCSNAEAIACDVNVLGTTVQSTSTDALACHSYPGVWYSFVGDGSMVNISTNNAGTTFDTYLAVSETCGGSCVAYNDDGGSNNTSVISLFQTTLGQTYYINVTGWSSTTGGDFELSLECGVTPASPPANDDCSGATVLAVGATCNYTSASTEGATESMPACGGTADDDVWFMFTATTQEALLKVQPSANFDAVVEVFSGTGCGDLASGGCVDGIGYGGLETGNLTGLVIGTDYYVRVYHYYSSSPINPTFDICVQEPPLPPANDDCAGAIELTVGQTCTTVIGDVEAATQSLIACTGTAEDDVWYSFVAVTPEVTIDVTGSADFDAVFEVFEGSCGTLVSVECVEEEGGGDTETTNVPDLIIGETYYIRVYDYWSYAPSTTTFEICVHSMTVGIQENLDAALSVYPNPSNGQFVVEVNGIDADAHINVMDVMGRQVYTQQVALSGNFRKTLNLDVAKGTYLLQITSVEGTVTRKIQVN